MGDLARMSWRWRRPWGVREARTCWFEMGRVKVVRWVTGEVGRRVRRGKSLSTFFYVL
jgi:hypothetical protein